MFESSPLDWVVLVAVSLAVFVGTMLWLNLDRVQPDRLSERRGQPSLTDMVFLFDGKDLIDSSTTAWHFVGRPESGYGWPQFFDLVSTRYPGLPDHPDAWRDKGRVVLKATEPERHGEMLFEWIDGIARLEIRIPQPAERPTDAETPSAEHSLSHNAVEKAPFPVWCLNEAGEVAWSNTAYDKLRNTVGTETGAPASSLFPSPSDERSPQKGRHSVAVSADGPRLWYDVTSIRDGDGWLRYAGDVNAIVEAEAAQRNFVQTLAKTFSQLSIGLAIFDRNRQLALFNPALIDLTALPADFLSARPSILSFFDRLRDQRMMPEPKNYGSWRQQMTDLVEAAASGQYQETWSLPSGSVYSVSGRPHPDGAVAFLFEDITAEIKLTRRFRAELELGQSILDHIEDAIVVFSSDGTQTFSNATYNEMWGVDPDNSFAQVTISDATRTWQDSSAATPAWGEIRDFVALRENRTEWWARVVRKSGETLICSVSPINSGATLVRFTSVTTTEASPINSPALETLET